MDLPYQFEPNVENYPPMVLKIQVKNSLLSLCENLTDADLSRDLTETNRKMLISPISKIVYEYKADNIAAVKLSLL